MGLHTLLEKLSPKDVVPAAPAVTSDKPSKKEIMQNRYQYGPNFGGMFVLEKWIDNSLFTDKADGDSELAALEGAKKSGQSLQDMQKKWEDHWINFINDNDWKILVNAGVTAVRLPIGFWNVDGGKFTKRTPFSDFAEVYKNSWHIIKDVIRKAGSYDIGVLVDIHCVPGGANKDAHSGTNSGKAAFWDHSHFRDAAVSVYEYAVKDLKDAENVVGIQLINEAPWGESKLKSFYLEAAAKIRHIDSSIPIVISDGWNLDEWRKTIKNLDQSISSKSKPQTTGFVIDTHVYRMFSDQDKKQPANELVKRSIDSVSKDPEVDTIVGEYSCVLSEESWGKVNNRDQLEVQYGQDENKNFEQSTAGSYFWTYKFAQGSGGGWDFRAMLDKGALPHYARSLDVNKPNLDNALTQALGAHKQYWDKQNSKTDWEHWRFEDGFRRGFEDSKIFGSFNGSRVGRLAAMTTARLAENVKQKGGSDKEWVFTQGYHQGVNAFNSQV